MEDTGAEWVSVKVAAGRTGLSTKTIHRRIKTGKVEAQRSGDAKRSPWLVRVDSVEVPPAGPTAPETTALARLDAVLESMDELRRDWQEAVERAAKAETQAEFFRERMTEVRDGRDDALQELAQARLELRDARRRWWRRRPGT